MTVDRAASSRAGTGTDPTVVDRQAEKRVAIVIVNYRSASFSTSCIDSIARSNTDVSRIRVYVVDNDSGDGSAQAIRDHVQQRAYAWVEVIQAGTNRGFGAGNNIALARILAGHIAPYVLLLNPDTVVTPDAIDRLAERLDRDPGAAIAGGRLTFPDGKPQTSTFRFPGPVSELVEAARSGSLQRAVEWLTRARTGRPTTGPDWVTGACLMIRAAALRQVGVFDERFFLYFEEVDLCRRCKLAGWVVCHEPSALVAHACGVTVAAAISSSWPVPAWCRSRRLYYLKHHGQLGLLTANLSWAVGFACYVLRSLLRGRLVTDMCLARRILRSR